MSYIIAPDPHPGRCPNFRTVYGSSVQNVRCLELASTRHVCRFPEVVTVTSNTAYSQPKPTPWMPPVGYPGEGPHHFPGVEVFDRGGEFFASQCSYGCGAFLADARSSPARDRLDYGRATSQYGDVRGVGTCPNNLESVNAD